MNDGFGERLTGSAEGDRRVSVPGVPGDIHAVSGVVLDAASNLAVPGVVVEVWDKDRIGDDYLGQGIADASGRFSLEFDRSRYQDLFKLETFPDLYFKVFRKKELLYDSADQPLANLGHEPSSVTLRIGGGPVTQPPVVVARRSIDERIAGPADGARPVDASGFGVAFVSRVFTPELLAGEVERLIGERKLQERQQMERGPISVQVVTEAEVGKPALRQISDLVFDVTIPVSMRVHVQGRLGPIEGGERYAIEARASFRLTIKLHDSLLIQVDATRVESGHIILQTRTESPTYFARCEVEKGAREELAKKFNEALVKSRPARTIDVQAEVQRFLARSPG